ncbi:MAG: hypothetical protein COA78_23190 [Blastopirellula sp.]|nr:MAG: hypothetical protein COA78_23190 [Blastopirellula sp.]
MKDHLRSSIAIIVISLCTLVAIVGLGIGAWVLSEQVDSGPTPFYMSDDVQYYAEGPEFKLQREADALQFFRTEQATVEALDWRSRVTAFVRRLFMWCPLGLTFAYSMSEPLLLL